MYYGIFDWYNYNIDYRDNYKLIKQAGFDKVILWWGEEYEDKKLKYDYAIKADLAIESVHFTFSDVNLLWSDSLGTQTLMNLYHSYIDDCYSLNIPIAVMHCTNRHIDVPLNEIGLRNFGELAEHAEKKNIIIAIENVHNLSYTDYIFNNISSSYLGFCYDSGHENTFQKGVDVLSKYGHRLVTTHLHNNHGQEDEHNLLSKGSINWNKVITRLNNCKPIDTLCLEIEMNKQTDLKSNNPSMFLHKAYQELVKITKKIDFS